MARNDIPDEHHLVRYISWAKLLKDEFDNVTGVLPEAFTLRDDEPFLSAAWQEYYRCSEIEQI